MSTEERDKALAAREATFADAPRDAQAFIAADLMGFRAGWDARGQVTPDREAGVMAIIAAIMPGYRQNPETPLDFGVNKAAREQAGLAYDAILVLFNEKGTP